MKNLLMILIVVFCANVLNAQQDPKAKKILDSVSQKTKSFTSIQADFNYIFESLQENISDTLQGKILIKGEKYKLTFSEYERFFDGTNITTVMLEEGKPVEATLSLPNEEGEELNPSEIFTIYQKDFKYRYREEVKEKGKQMHLIELFPIDVDAKRYSRIQIKIDKANNQIYSFKEFDKDGNRITIELTKVQTNKPLSEKNFTFDTKKFPDIEIVDLRE
ncbi:MAG: hypothetical protein CSA05_00065 [Bacteroidia bacterium]|nr:MAG: hypothetical protein CSB01_00940 [Bacteroidia bacterium]PIE86522.1 MAG: hypothetical protein CSA05_00065 [Bacteroidia bacterium]